MKNVYYPNYYILTIYFIVILENIFKLKIDFFFFKKVFNEIYKYFFKISIQYI